MTDTVNSTVSSDYQSAHPFSCSASESELSEEDEDDDDEEDDDEEEEEDEEELELLLFISASFPFTALSLLPVRSGGWRLAGGDRFPLWPRCGCLPSGWLLPRDLCGVTSERRESDCEPLPPEGGAWEESLEAPCEAEGRLFCSLLSSCWSALLSLSDGPLLSFLSGGGDCEDAEEEEELEEDDDEEEDLRGWGTSFGCRLSFSFSLSRSCSSSLLLTLSRSLSLSLSRESERLVLLRRCGDGDRRGLRGGKIWLYSVTLHSQHGRNHHWIAAHNTLNRKTMMSDYKLPSEVN